MSNNPFSPYIKGTPPAAPPEPNPSVPNVIILDPVAEGVVDYAISWNQLTALETVYIISNVTSIGGSTIPIYLPAVSSTQSGTKITIISMSADDLTIACGAGAMINGNTGYTQSIKPSNGVATGMTSVTYIADGQLTPQWYSIYNFIKI
jgi:hypothetical protein